MALRQDKIFAEFIDRILWTVRSSRLAVFLKPLPPEKENAPPLEFFQFFPMFLVEQQGEEQRWEKLTGTQKFRIVGCEKIPTTDLTPIKTDDAPSKSEVQDMCGSKITLGIPQTPEPITRLPLFLK